MPRLTKFLTPLLLASATFLGGCAGRAVIMSDEPPPRRAERVSYRSGHVWVPGHWERRGNSWSWRDGYYERERLGHTYVEGRWVRNGRNWVWVEGQWRRGDDGVISRRDRRY